ncbi:hypothetical protein ZWY2020_051087 [Hordeum vulgare]|nr:hypothetical protein ZWY2020_051087 [Hordeum vulgare]
MQLAPPFAPPSLLPPFMFALLGVGGRLRRPYVSVTISTAVTNLLSPSDLAAFLRAQRITHVRLYDADPRLLSALASSGASAIVGVPNDELLALGSSRPPPPPGSPAGCSPTPRPHLRHRRRRQGPHRPALRAPRPPPAIQSLAAALTAANLSSIPSPPRSLSPSSSSPSPRPRPTSTSPSPNPSSTRSTPTSPTPPRRSCSTSTPTTR